MTEHRRDDILELLPVTLTQEEVDQYARELREATDSIAEHEVKIENLKLKQKGHKNAVEWLQGRISELAVRIDERAEVRSVACHELEDFDEKAVRLYRSDTGELVRERAMLPSELQRSLLPDDDDQDDDEHGEDAKEPTTDGEEE